jgi:hypothetical protein
MSLFLDRLVAVCVTGAGGPFVRKKTRHEVPAGRPAV